MTEPFRFSPNENRAPEIRWRHWSTAAFDEAVETDRPVLLCVTARWCEACHRLDETVLSDDRVIELANERLLPVRVDGDRRPDVQDRYIAGGWPTVALLTPTGEVFWSGVEVDARELLRIAGGVLDSWADGDDRKELEEEIGRRRRAMEAARSRRPGHGLVRREAADDVLSGAQEQFDPRNGGFGDAPKFIHTEAVELLYDQGEALPNPDWVEMAGRTLDGMLAGEIEDPVEGGFYHYALEADWTRPQTEKLLSVNARVLHALAVAAERTGREDAEAAADRTVDWVDRTLARDGLWVGSQAARAEHFRHEERDPQTAPTVDDTVYTDAAAMWIAALAEAGRVLGREEWVERASSALDTLLERHAALDDALVHYRVPDGEPPTGLLTDLLHAARAAEAVARATGREDAREQAERLVARMKDTLWDEDGGFCDVPYDPDPVGALRFRDRPFEENALAARLHVALARATANGSYRAVAERILAFLSPLAGRYAVEGSTFALAVEEFFALRRR